MCDKCKCTCESPVNYVGKLVFVEASREGITDMKQYSNYYGGEYFIVRQTPFTLYGVKLVDGDYLPREVRTLPLAGPGRFIVCEVAHVDRQMVIDHVERVWLNGTKPERGEKLHYVETVYSELKETARLIARVIGYDLAVPKCATVTSFDRDRLTGIEKRLKGIEDAQGTLLGKLR